MDEFIFVKTGRILSSDEIFDNTTDYLEATDAHPTMSTLVNIDFWKNYAKVTNHYCNEDYNYLGYIDNLLEHTTSNKYAIELGEIFEVIQDIGSWFPIEYYATLNYYMDLHLSSEYFDEEFVKTYGDCEL